MNFIHKVEIHGHIGMLEIIINLLFTGLGYQEIKHNQQSTCLATLLLLGNNLFIIVVIKVNVDVVDNVVEIILVVVILVVIVVAVGIVVVLHIVAVIIVVGIIVVVLVVADGIIIGEHLCSLERQILDLELNEHSFLQLVLI